MARKVKITCSKCGHTSRFQRSALLGLREVPCVDCPEMMVIPLLLASAEHRSFVYGYGKVLAQCRRVLAQCRRVIDWELFTMGRLTRLVHTVEFALDRTSNEFMGRYGTPLRFDDAVPICLVLQAGPHVDALDLRGRAREFVDRHLAQWPRTCLNTDFEQAVRQVDTIEFIVDFPSPIPSELDALFAREQLPLWKPFSLGRSRLESMQPCFALPFRVVLREKTAQKMQREGAILDFDASYSVHYSWESEVSEDGSFETTPFGMHFTAPSAYIKLGGLRVSKTTADPQGRDTSKK